MDGLRIESPADAGKRMLRESGYKDGGGVKEGELKKVVRKALIGHEDDEHEGEHHRIKVKSGGKVAGKHAKHRPDRHRRADGGGMPAGDPKPGGEKNRADEGRARGGATKKGKGGVNITIKTGGEGDGQQKEQMAAQQGMRVGQALGARRAAEAMAGGAGGPPRPPMGGPPPGGAPTIPPGGPMAGPGGPPRPMMAPGAPMGAKDGGHIKVRAHQRRKAGGRVEDCD